MTDARRDRLPDTRGGDNPGLLLNRYLPVLGDDSKAVRLLNETLAGKSVSPAYKDAFVRWQKMHEARKPKAVLTPETLAGPLAVGLGNASPTEVGLTTSHPYGMPVIPGSAIKGVCRRGALKMMEMGLLGKDEFHALFGDTKSASYFVFWDAWYVPTDKGHAFHPDTITVHHPDYYSKRGNGNAWPTDFDDPNPVPFLVVPPGAKFLFVLDAPTPDWGKFALDLLCWSLANIGVGGKTNAGYGYFVDRQKPQNNAPMGSTSQQSGSPAQPSTQEWLGVTVYRDGSTGDLSVTHEGQKAFARQAQVQTLYASLPDEAVAKLKDKKIKRLDGVTVQVKINGNNRQIVGITLPKGEKE